MLTTKPQNDRCRFDLFVRLKIEADFRFKSARTATCFCFRGDKYSKDDIGKMLKYLIGIVKNHHRQYVTMELYDNSLPKTSEDRVVLKIHNGIAKRNVLPNYADLLTDFALPEHLSYEIK